MLIDVNKLSKIDTDLITPTINENLIEMERDKWGNILNEKTFKTLNSNIRILKDVVLEIINNTNLLNLDTVKLKLNNIQTDITKLEGLININEQKTEITTGSDTSTYTIKGVGNHLKYNGKDLARVDELPVLPDLSKYVKTDTPNTLTQKLTGTEIKANTIETTNLKVNGKNIETDFTNFAKLNTTNTFTQKIKGTDIESNKLITNELLLNGVNVNLTDYSTNDNVVKQIEKVVGLTYGGNIQDSGNKTTGKFYFDSVNNYFYECISNNNLTYVDNSKFRPISNKPISDTVNEIKLNWNLIFSGLVIDLAERSNFNIVIPKNYSKMKIVWSYAFDNPGITWQTREVDIQKINYDICQSENYITYYKEDNTFYYYKLTRNNNSNDNYVYLFAR